MFNKIFTPYRKKENKAHTCTQAPIKHLTTNLTRKVTNLLGLQQSLFNNTLSRCSKVYFCSSVVFDVDVKAVRGRTSVIKSQLYVCKLYVGLFLIASDLTP